MKRIVSTAVAVLISFCAFAQKLKIEKGAINLDEKTVAYIEGKKPLFKVFNLDKSYAVNVELKFLDDGAFGKRWMIVKSEKTGKSNEVDFKKFSPQNQEKSTVQTFIDKNFLTAEGLNIDAVENYINGESTGVSVKIKEEQNEIAQQKAYEDRFQLAVDDNGTIYSKNVPIGYIKMILTNGNTGGVERYEVTDLDNYIIGSWFAKSGSVKGYHNFLNQELITYDKKVFKILFDNGGNFVGYKMSKDITAMNIVKNLVLNGYTLGHQYTGGKQ
jgi:hypothetical protein